MLSTTDAAVQQVLVYEGGARAGVFVACLRGKQPRLTWVPHQLHAVAPVEYVLRVFEPGVSWKLRFSR